MGYATQEATKVIVYPALSQNLGALEEIRRLEKQAMDHPEMREAIVSALNSHAHRFKHKPSSKAAKDAVSRIRAVTMLEILCEGEETD